MTGRGTAIMLLALLAVVAGVAVAAAGPDTDTQVRTVTRQALVDGHPVGWWAHRARRNGDRMRRHYDRLLELRQAVRDRIDLDGDIAAGLLCIHAHEGSWADPNAPYYGGLQMDYSFQRTYGAEFLNALGTADRWPPFVQVAVGLRAVYSGRGYGPWPTARRSCGL